MRDTRQVGTVDRPLGRRIDQCQVRGLPHLDGTALIVEADDCRGALAHDPGNTAPVQQAGLDHRPAR